MGLLSFLFGRTPTTSDPAPDIVISVTLAPMAPWTEERETDIVLAEETSFIRIAPPQPTQPKREHGGAHAWAGKETFQTDPLFCLIDYVDAAGEPSRRRVTIRRIIRDADRLWLGAYCHERKASRSFRADRVRNFITSDGEVIEARQFLADFLGVETTGGTPAFPSAEALQESLIDHLRPAMTILVAASRSDFHVHLDEIDAILLYIEREASALVKAGRLSLMPSLETLDAMKPRLDTMRPLQSDVAQALIEVLDWDTAAFRRLGRALENVVYADGVLRDAEAQFVDELLALRRHDANGRHKGIFAHVDQTGLQKRLR